MKLEFVAANQKSEGEGFYLYLFLLFFFKFESGHQFHIYKCLSGNWHQSKEVPRPSRSVTSALPRHANTGNSCRRVAQTRLWRSKWTHHSPAHWVGPSGAEWEESEDSWAQAELKKWKVIYTLEYRRWPLKVVFPPRQPTFHPRLKAALINIFIPSIERLTVWKGSVRAKCMISFVIII